MSGEYQGPNEYPHISWWRRFMLAWRARREARR